MRLQIARANTEETEFYGGHGETDHARTDTLRRRNSVNIRNIPLYSVSGQTPVRVQPTA